MDKGITPGERALLASEAWSLAKARGDERLRVAALRDYRDAMRELRAQRAEDIEAQLARLDALRHTYRADWAS
jgi:hypothetical protein